MPLYDLTHAIGTVLPIVVHYQAHTVPASFVGDPTQYGLYHGATRVDTGGHGVPHLLSAVIGDPSYGLYEFRFESAYLDTLNPGDTYSFRIAEDSYDEQIWTLRIYRPTLQELAAIQGLLNSGLASVYTRLDGLAAVVQQIYDYVIIGPIPPHLGQTNTIGDGNIFATSYAGGAEVFFLNGRVSDPNLAYAIAPFNPGEFQLLLSGNELPAPPPAAINFRTKDPICGLKLGSIFKAYASTDGVVYAPLGDDLTMDGTTNAQQSGGLTWEAYGPAGVPGVSPLTTLPNGDLVGYVRFNYSPGSSVFAHYLDIKLEQVVGATTYNDYLMDYRPLPGVSGGVLVDPNTPVPTGSTQIVQPAPTPVEPDPTLRRLSGVLYAAGGFLLNLILSANDLYRSCYGPAAGGGAPVLFLNEAELGNSNETFNPIDLGSGAVPLYNAAVSAALGRTVGLAAGGSAVSLPATLYHPLGDVSIGNSPLADLCRILTWPAASDTDTVLYFKDETRRCVQNIGGPPPPIAFDTYDFSAAPPFFTPGAPPVIWDSTQDVDYDSVGPLDLGLQVLPSGLPPLPGVGDGLLIYPQHNFGGGIPLDGVSPRNYVGRVGTRLYRSYFRTLLPQPGGSLILDGLTFADIQDLPGQRAKIELRLPENFAAQWGSLGTPQGIPPFTGLYLGSPGPGDTVIPFAFTPGVHSTNGSTGDTDRYVQVRITFYDAAPNLMFLGSLTIVP